MSTPTGSKTKPTTRSSRKKTCGDGPVVTSLHVCGSSPVLKSARKRKSSAADTTGEPASKRMAENQLLEAINGIRTSVNAMEAQMKNVPSKADLAGIVTEIRGVKESVIRNTDRIDTLFDLRKNDDKLLARRVEKLVEGKISGATALGQAQASGSNEQSFLLCRRSMRLWPVANTSLEQGVQTFLKNTLKIPDAVVSGLEIEKIERVSQTRRSKIVDEVLVRFGTSQQRDVVQSYASNLAEVQGNAGIRLEVPDYLRGLFRQFESHAANLRTKFGPFKRAVRFDDVDRSLYMDVKLDSTDWHRLTAKDIRKVHATAKGSTGSQPASAKGVAEKKKILLQEDRPDCYQVVSDEDEFSDAEENEPKK